jgi:hypothetical protein
MPWGCTYHGDADTADDFWQAAERAVVEYKNFAFLSGAALPGFDNRGCGGWGSDGAIGITSSRNGDKLRATFEDVSKHNAKFIQIATWNDLNEGGTIEPVRTVVLHQNSPAEGYGYRELETVAEYAGKLKGVTFDKNALRLPTQIYFARKMVEQAKSKKYPLPDNVSLSSVWRDIDKARNYLLAGKTSSAQKLLAEIDSVFPQESKLDSSIYTH